MLRSRPAGGKHPRRPPPIIAPWLALLKRAWYSPTAQSVDSPMCSTPKGEGGVALITAMLITALVSVIAVGMVARQQLDIRRTANVLDNDQAYLYALGLESWGMQILARDASKGPVDHGGEDWAQGLAPIAVEGGAVSGDIQDLQGRYNLNNLLQDGAVNQLELQRLRRLLGALEVSPELAEARYWQAVETLLSRAEDYKKKR